MALYSSPAEKQETSIFDTVAGFGKSLQELEFLKGPKGAEIDKNLERLKIKSETVKAEKSFLQEWLPESMKDVDDKTLASFAISGAALLASNTDLVTSDKSIKDKLDKLGYGAAALGLVSLAPEKYKNIGYMAVGTALLYFLGKDAWNMTTGMLGLAKDFAISPIETFQKYSENPSLLLEKLGLKDDKSKQGQTDRMEKREKAVDDPAEQAKLAEQDGKNRTKLIGILTLRSNERTATVLVNDMSDITIETFLDNYEVMKLNKKISGKENLADLLKKVYDNVLAVEEQKFEDNLPWHQKGIIKGMREAASLGFSCIPVIGNGYTAITALTGEDYIGGDTLSTTERVVAAGVTLIPFGALAKGAAKGVGKVAAKGILGGRLSKLGLVVRDWPVVKNGILSVPHFEKVAKLRKDLVKGKITQAVFDAKVAQFGFDPKRTALLADHIYPGARKAKNIVGTYDIFSNDESMATIKNMVALQELEQSMEIAKGKVVPMANYTPRQLPQIQPQNPEGLAQAA